MSSVITANFFRKLRKEGSISLSATPKSRYIANDIDQLQEAGILMEEKAGRGKRLLVKKPEKLDVWLTANLPAALKEVVESKGNREHEGTINYGNSKAISIPSKYLYLKGKPDIDLKIGGQTVSLADMPAWGYLGGWDPNEQLLATAKVCFVENYKGAFQYVSTWFGAFYQQGYLFIYGYMNTKRKVDAKCFANIQAEQILFAPDYDYVGLNAYLCCKRYQPHTQLYVPSNYDTLYERCSKPLPDGFKPIKRVTESQEPIIVHMCKQMQKHHRFLEQQAIGSPHAT